MASRRTIASAVQQPGHDIGSVCLPGWPSDHTTLALTETLPSCASGVPQAADGND
jgi:hypothetical protein